ncbi:MAG: putative metal-binding motif-containing protein [Deltaproteobacteria bacterium]|nr:putative metal-binding motif-containing protein [Deltaproteobacteria bacterium]
MSTRHLILVFTTLFVQIALVGRSDAITIDAFEGTQQLTAMKNSPASATFAGEKIIGGVRSVHARITNSGDGFLNLQTSGGLIRHSQDALVSGQSIVVWDGDSVPDDSIFPSSPLGLNSLDLTQDNADRFVLHIKSFDYAFGTPINLTFYIWDAESRFSFVNLPLTESIQDGLKEILFTDFAAGPGSLGAADFTKVGAIVLIINGLSPDVDLTLDHLTTNGECDIIPVNGLAKKDLCGVCAGDNSSCSDCKDVPNGTALPGTTCETGDIGLCSPGTYDGACKCVSDNPPTAEQCDGIDNDCNGQVDDGVVCLTCQKIATAEISFELDHGAKQHERLIKQMVAKLTGVDRSKKTAKYSKKTLEQAHTLQVRNWVLSWTLPPQIYTCSASPLCTQVSNTEILDEYRTHSEELRQIGLQVAKRLKKVKVKTNPFLKRNQKLHDANIALANTVPLSTSVCTSYPET